MASFIYLSPALEPFDAAAREAGDPVGTWWYCPIRVTTAAGDVHETTLGMGPATTQEELDALILERITAHYDAPPPPEPTRLEVTAGEPVTSEKVMAAKALAESLAAGKIG